MNFKTTIVLLILLAAVGIVVLVTGNNKTPAPQTTEGPTGISDRKLLDLKPDHVDKVTIVDASGNHTTLVKDNGQWKLTEPVNSAAIDYMATQVVSQLAGIISHGRPESKPSDSGLDKPRYTIELNSDDGKSVTVMLGNKTGVGDVMYAQVQGSNDINLVDATLDKTLKTVAVDLRDKHLIAAKETEIRQIKISYGNKTIELSKPSDKWIILQPERMVADEEAVQSLVYAMTQMEATQFVKADSDEAALADFNRPTLTAWFSTEKPTTRPATTRPEDGTTITIGGADGPAKDHYFVKVSGGEIAKVDKSVLDGLEKTPLDLRNKDVVTIVPGQVKQISIMKDTFAAPAATQPSMKQTPEKAILPISSKRVVLVKRKIAAPVMGPPLPTTGPSSRPAAIKPEETQSAWQFEGDDKTQIDDSKVADLLAKFDPLRADKFLEAEPTTGVLNRYVVEITTLPANGIPVIYRFNFRNPAGAEQNPNATYDVLNFEVPKTLLDGLDLDFTKGAVAPAAVPPPPMFPGGR